MKKIVCLALMMLIPMTAWGAVVSYTTLSGDSGLSYNHLNTSFATIYDEFNGGIDSDNIEDDSITEPDFADAVNPRVRDYEMLGNFTYTGQIPEVPASGLTAITTAGTSYVQGYRVVTAATSKAYTASRDTYVYIDQNGAFSYSAVSNGATQPATPANSLLLAKVVTDATDVTGVTDLRQTTPPNLRIYNNYKNGCYLQRNATTTNQVDIYPGEIELGASVSNGLRRNLTKTTVTFSTSGRGGLDTGSMASETYYYIYAIADDDTSTQFECVASASSSDATGFTDERLIGYCYSTGATISVDNVAAYRGTGGDAPNTIHRYLSAPMNSSNVFTSSSNSWIDVPNTQIKFFSGNRPVLVQYSASSTANANGGNPSYAVFIDGEIQEHSWGFSSNSAVGSSDAFDKQQTANGQCVKFLVAGPHTISLRTRAQSGITGYTLTRDIIAMEL